MGRRQTEAEWPVAGGQRELRGDGLAVPRLGHSEATSGLFGRGYENILNSRAVYAVFLNVCCSRQLRCGGLCSRVRFKAQQSGVHVTVAKSIPEVGKGCVLPQIHANQHNPTLLQDSLLSQNCRARHRFLHLHPKRRRCKTSRNIL